MDNCLMSGSKKHYKKWAIFDESRQALNQGYECDSTRAMRLYHDCWRHILGQWTRKEKTQNVRLVSLGIGSRHQVRSFLGWLQGDEQVHIVHILRCLMKLDNSNFVKFWGRQAKRQESRTPRPFWVNLCLMKKIQFRSRPAGEPWPRPAVGRSRRIEHSPPRPRLGSYQTGVTSIREIFINVMCLVVYLFLLAWFTLFLLVWFTNLYKIRTMVLVVSIVRILYKLINQAKKNRVLCSCYQYCWEF